MYMNPEVLKEKQLRKDYTDKVKSKFLGKFIAEAIERNPDLKTRFENDELEPDEFLETDEGKDVKKRYDALGQKPKWLMQAMEQARLNSKNTPSIAPTGISEEEARELLAPPPEGSDFKYNLGERVITKDSNDRYNPSCIGTITHRNLFGRHRNYTIKCDKGNIMTHVREDLIKNFSEKVESDMAKNPYGKLYKRPFKIEEIEEGVDEDDELNPLNDKMEPWTYGLGGKKRKHKKTNRRSKKTKKGKKSKKSCKKRCKKSRKN